MKYCKNCCQIKDLEKLQEFELFKKNSNYYSFIWIDEINAICIQKEENVVMFLISDNSAIAKISVENELCCPHKKLFLSIENAKDLIYLMKNSSEELWRNYLKQVWK